MGAECRGQIRDKSVRGEQNGTSCFYDFHSIVQDPQRYAHMIHNLAHLWKTILPSLSQEVDPLNQNTSPVTPPSVICLLLVRRKEGHFKSRQMGKRRFEQTYRHPTHYLSSASGKKVHVGPSYNLILHSDLGIWISCFCTLNRNSLQTLFTFRGQRGTVCLHFGKNIIY